MAASFHPKPSLEAFHGSARILGVNEFTLQGYEEILTMNGSLYAYAVGVIVPAVLMVVMCIIWGCGLTCQKCCKRCCFRAFTEDQQVSDQYSILAVFSLFLLTSIVAWGVGLQSNVDTTVGFQSFLGSVDVLVAFVDDGIAGINQTRNLVGTLSALADVVLVDCAQFGGQSADPQVIKAPFQSALAAIDDLLPSLVNTVDTTKIQVYGTISEVNGYLYWRETGTMIVLICLVVLLFAFLCITVFRVLQLHPEQISTCTHCMVMVSKTYSWLIFTLGLLLLFIAWVFIALIHVMGTLGSDLCMPNVNTNLNRLIGPFIDPSVGGNLVDPCLMPTSEAMQGLCYYQTCQGVNPLETLFSQVPNITAVIGDSIPTVNVTEMVQQALPNYNVTEISQYYNLTDLMDHYNYTEHVQNEQELEVFQDLVVCASSLEMFLSTTQLGVQGSVMVFQDLLDCERSVNPMYARIVYDGFCNGFVDGLYNSYVSFIVASVMMMLAFTVYRVFEFGDGLVPTAVDIDENGEEVRGGSVRSNMVFRPMEEENGSSSQDFRNGRTLSRNYPKIASQQQIYELDSYGHHQQGGGGHMVAHEFNFANPAMDDKRDPSV